MTTMIEQHPGKKSGNIAIRPYFDAEKENMGLEKYGLSLFDGVSHEESIMCITRNGIDRYVTGLNEFAPEIVQLADPAVKEAKIKAIRIAVSELEKELASNIIEITDTDFWNKVKLLKPDNFKFWKTINIRCSNQPTFIDPAKDPYDRIKLYALEAGGFSMVAPNLEAARKMASSPKFFLDKAEETISLKTEVKKLRNTALALLQEMFSKNSKKLFYVAKVTDANSAQYKRATPHDIVYDNMDTYINGLSFEKNKVKSAETFIHNAEQDMATLKLRAIIRDSTYYKLIQVKGDGFIYEVAGNTILGKKPADVLEFLKNPLNESILTELTRGVESYWNS